MGFFPRGAILAGFGEPLNLFKKAKCCERCGKPNLYWHKYFGAWRLHHYATLDGKRNEFILHRCGYQSDGQPSIKFPWPKEPRP